MSTPPGTARALIDKLVSGTGAADAVSAIRGKAEEAIYRFVQAFGEPEEFPLNLLELASFLGISESTDAPAFSPDAELAPNRDGGVEIRLNPDRPETRQRFSIGHEITHTFFPDHTSHVWPRADARYRDLSNPDDYLEMLCDVGAAELVFPRRWFVRDAVGVASAADLLLLAARHTASRQATVRRYAELSPDAVAAVFFSWKLKPRQEEIVGREDSPSLFGLTPAEEIRDAVKLRIDYAIPSESFAVAGHFLPRDKSVKNDGPLYAAAASGQPCDGECALELGRASGTYRVHAVPLWTPGGERGPRREYAVAAIVRPVAVQQPRKKRTQPTGPSLF